MSRFLLIFADIKGRSANCYDLSNILPPVRTFGIAFPVVVENAKQPVLQARKMLLGTILPADAVEMV
jgi:hypothetical protein